MGTDVELVFVGDYADSVTLYASGQYNGVSVTNMDVLSLAGAGNRKSTAVIVGDYSNGNDGVALIGYKSVSELAGVPVHLVEYSVSHYMLARCAEKEGVSMDKFLKTYKFVNTTDADIPGVVKNASENGEKVAAVSWNPMLMTVRNTDGVNVICTSADIPGEIIDMVVVGDEVDAKSRAALVGAWYEVLAKVKAGDPVVIKALSEQAGSSVEDFKAQLETTYMFWTPAEAVKFVRDVKLQETMKRVVNFSFNAGVYDSVKSPDELGVEFSDGTVQGDKNNVMLVFDPSVMQQAADGKVQ
jgi:NitT/TauT family transport system substrate-binding protein